ncbi:MAG: hypothetical protein GY814_01255 [Gammaproteobacteria bacterium]|nr:hypothetical protein [Gammaproteobacteria bacterium]
MAVFSGQVQYKRNSSGKVTEAAIRMQVDPVSRDVILVEQETKTQLDFDVSGCFEGILQVDRKSVVGVWRKSGYARVADFSIFSAYQTAVDGRE